MGCELIIITTVLKIDEFFRQVFENEQEPITQLKRRIGTYIVMDKHTIRVQKWDDLNMCYSEPWKPEIGMTERQAEKEVQRQAFIFEEKCKNNLIPEKSVKFKDLAEEWLNLISVTKEQKIGSIERLKSCKERTYRAIGILLLINLVTDKFNSLF